MNNNIDITTTSSDKNSNDSGECHIIDVHGSEIITDSQNKDNNENDKLNSIIPQNSDEEAKKTKVIQPYSFPMDNHEIELPMFLNYPNKKVNEKIDLDKHTVLKQVVNIKEVNESEHIEKAVFSSENNNLNRKLFMYNVGKLPRSFEQDVLNALVLIFVEKNAPFKFGEEGYYNIHTDKVYFTFYEVCTVLQVEPSGFYIKKVKDAISILKTTQYFSFDDGVFYDKAKNEYVVSKQKGISWIADYDFVTVKSTKNMTSKDLNWVQFGNFMIHNLKYGYFNYLGAGQKLFFQLSTGFTRSVYAYIDKNMFDHEGKKLTYIKRYYDVLMYKLALNYQYPSQLKRRLKPVLEELMEQGLIADYFYGDEVEIGGNKEDCIYICSVKKEKVIKELEKKVKQKYEQIGFIKSPNEVGESEENNISYLKIPEDIKAELIRLEVDNSRLDVILKQDKWKVIKYIIWINKQISLGKIKSNLGGLLASAILTNYDITKGNTNLEIAEFIKEKMNEANQNKEEKVKVLDELYDEYIQQEVKKFKDEAIDIYNFIYDTVLSDIEARIDTLITNTKIGGGDITQFEEFKEKKEKSKYFKKMLLKEIRLTRNLKTKEQFKEEQLKS